MPLRKWARATAKQPQYAQTINMKRGLYAQTGKRIIVERCFVDERA